MSNPRAFLCWSLALRPQPFLTALAGVAIFAVTACGPTPKNATGQNLVLVTLDTLRADRVGAYGHTLAETPYLDRLAADGARFADVSATAPLTLPSHATILSGRLPLHHGLRHNGLGRFPDELETLATRLTAAGYRSAAFVAAFVLDARFGLDRGFAHYDDEIERSEAGRPLRLEAERRADVVIDRALAWLAEQDGETPLFLWVHLYDPHAPYAAPEPWARRFAERPYDGEIAYTDAQVGRLLDAFEKRGLDQRTVVAVVGDHGEALGEHGEASHGLLLYEAALRVPWIVRAPGTIEPGREIAAPVSLADVAPTLLGLLGLPPDETTDADLPRGRDLSAVLVDGGEPTENILYAETEYPTLYGWAPLAAARRGALKLIDAPRPELFDVESDPAESQDMLRERRREYRELDSWLEETRATAVEAETAPVDAETRARLAALGYAGPLPSSKPRDSLPDPKDKVELYTAYETARRDLDQGATTAALPILTRLVEADPENPVFQGSLALALRRGGEIERALVHYREAAGLAPHDADAWQNLAAALREAGRPAEALEAAKEALRQDPYRAEARNLLGLAHLATGDVEAARRELERAVELDGDNAAYWNNLGNVRRATGDADAAADAYRHAIELAPRYADPVNGLATLLVERDAPAEALPHFDRVLELAPNFHEARLNRGIALELMGQNEAAAAAYRDFLEQTRSSERFAPQRRIAVALLERITG